MCHGLVEGGGAFLRQLFYQAEQLRTLPGSLATSSYNKILDKAVFPIVKPQDDVGVDIV